MHISVRTKAYFKLTTLSFFSLLVLFTLAFNIKTANAVSPGNLYPPFDIGAQWDVCQGYDSGTHKNNTQYGSKLAFDFTNSGCSNTASGKVVRAPFNGTVSWYVVNSGSMCITAEDKSKSVMLTHINDSVAIGADVNTYQAVGSIASSGNKQNNGTPHLHLQAWSSQNCSGNENQIPFDSTNGTRICGATDMPENGPRSFGNGTWGSTRFKADSCSTTIPPASPTVFRLYNPSIQRHLYTTDVNEVNVIRSRGGWNFEGVAYWVKSKNGCSTGEAVYRFYNIGAQVHLYTTDENERNILRQSPNVWRYEGTAYCASRTQIANTKPVYRLYSDSLKSHLFTKDENEKNELRKHPETWKYEGVAYYVY